MGVKLRGDENDCLRAVTRITSGRAVEDVANAPHAGHRAQDILGGGVMSTWQNSAVRISCVSTAPPPSRVATTCTIKASGCPVSEAAAAMALWSRAASACAPSIARTTRWVAVSLTLLRPYPLKITFCFLKGNPQLVAEKGIFVASWGARVLKDLPFTKEFLRQFLKVYPLSDNHGSGKLYWFKGISSWRSNFPLQWLWEEELKKPSEPRKKTPLTFHWILVVW